MDFSLGDDRRMLVDTLNRYLSQHYTFAHREAIAASPEGWSRDTWQALAELGIIGALFDEAVGGFGGSPFDVGAVFAELGRALVVEPFLATLMAGRVLALQGGHDRLELMIAGTALVAFAHQEPASEGEVTTIATVARHGDAGWRLTGTKAVVAQLAQADHIVVTARSAGAAGERAGLSTFLLDRGAAGVSIRDYALIDGGSAGELVLNDAPATLIGEAGHAIDAIERSLAAGLVALSWEAVAIMDVLKDQTLDYLRTRKQFGIAIGRFQALQHRMATVALEIEQARSSAINAAAALDAPRAERERAASAAKYTVGRVGSLVAEEAVQMHGGIGMTWELPLSHYAKRLIMLGQQLSDEDYHLARFVSLGREETVAA